MDFFTRINYSIGNEDWKVEAQALQVQPGDNAICVTASGDRTLHLLMTDCNHIFSIDMNQSQNHLLALKLAAIAELDYETYLAFLPSQDRQSIFLKMKPYLSPECAVFWNKNPNLISRGIIYQGRTERLTQLAAKFFKFIRREKIQKLFQFSDLEEQKRFVEKEWDTPGLRRIFELLINPRLSSYLIKDPGLNSYVDTLKPGQYIYTRMITYLNHHLAKHSPLLQLLFTGTLTSEAYFPYLTLGGYNAIRRNMQRVSIIDGNIIDFMNSKELQNQIDCFSISDIASYMPQSTFENLLRSIQNAARPHARFCLREFMSNRNVPDNLMTTYRRNSLLEKKLEKEETNFVYRFIAGEIHK